VTILLHCLRTYSRNLTRYGNVTLQFGLSGKRVIAELCQFSKFITPAKDVIMTMIFVKDNWGTLLNSARVKHRTFFSSERRDVSKKRSHSQGLRLPVNRPPLVIG
jgi:hypothetical protein